MTREEVQAQINELLQTKLFAAMKKIIVSERVNKFTKSQEYLEAFSKKTVLDNYYKICYDSVSSFYMNYQSIFAIEPLVEREIAIRNFINHDVIRVKAEYLYKGIEFSAYYPAHFTADMTREIEDCKADLLNEEFTHVVSDYTSKKETEKEPAPLLTNARLKNGAFYLLTFDPSYTTMLATKLYEAGLITSPETNGAHLDNHIADQIISFLYMAYPKNPDMVLGFKREMGVDEHEEECIRPTNISTSYAPKNITETMEFENIDFKDYKERDDAIQLYTYIHYTTLSTQLKNSVYDTSSVKITVGSRILREQAHVILEGRENWEKLSGSFVKKIQKDSNIYNDSTVVLPEFTINDELKPITAYAYEYPRRRPPRYGIGRFLTQILESNHIGKNSEHDKIIQNMVESKAVLRIKQILHPQDNAIILIQWLRKHQPQLVNLDYYKELEDKIASVVNGSFSIDTVIEELDRLIESGFVSAGFQLEDSTPSEAKIAFMKKIAKAHSIQIPQEALTSTVQADIFISKNPMPEAIVLGRCPNCNAQVEQREYADQHTGEVSYYFTCSNAGRSGTCNFTVWDNMIYKYFSARGKEYYTIEERADIVKKLLSKKKGYQFDDFISKAKVKYNAKVFFAPYKDDKGKTRWGLEQTFSRNRKAA